jgi:hypothetical protein
MFFFIKSLKSELFYLLSVVTLKNFHLDNVWEAFYKPADTVEYVIKSLMLLLLRVSHPSRIGRRSVLEYNDEENNNDDDGGGGGGRRKQSERKEDDVIYTAEDMAEMEVQVKAGLTICTFCYHNEEFTKKILELVGRINWHVYKYLFDKTGRMVAKARRKRNDEALFHLQRMRVYLGFQVSALHNLIYFEPSTRLETVEDARVIGMQTMMDIMTTCNNSLLRSIVCDYMGRLVSVDPLLTEAFVSINAIELLAKSTVNGGPGTPGGPGAFGYVDAGELEKGSAAISLAIFAQRSPEARRRLFKIARKNSRVMESMFYYNETLHGEILGQWRHLKELENKQHSESRQHLVRSGSTVGSNF